MIPYMVGKLAPNSSNLTRVLVNYVPGRGYFRAVSSQNGDKFVTSPPPPQSLNGSNNKNKETITQSTRQKKIKGHSIERVWYTASRKPSSTPPPPPRSKLSRICAQRRSIYNSLLSGFQVKVSLWAQLTPLGESLGRSNQTWL